MAHNTAMFYNSYFHSIFYSYKFTFNSLMVTK